MATYLSELAPDTTAVLRQVGGPRAYRRRLLELGFVPGTPLRLVRRLELGDVLEVELRSSRVSLRISEARVLEVEPGGTASPTAPPRDAGSTGQVVRVEGPRVSR